MEERLFSALGRLTATRKSAEVFDGDATVATREMEDRSLICVVRETESVLMKGFFNFGRDGKTVVVEEGERYRDMFNGRALKGETFWLEGHDFVWLQREKTENPEKGVE